VPVKYHIDAKQVPPRFRPVGKLGIVDWREDCANCHNCVKRGCVYGFYRNEADALREEVGYLDYIYQCKGCLTCVQNCTKGILTRVVNPEYERLGDAYYVPEILLSTWFQAETGSIPVSGAGYGGPFSGPAFDSMWTDMSEIVRPTRDGIHGREYINTGVDLGRKPDHLVFEDGGLEASPPPLIESPVPLIFDVIPERFQRGAVLPAMMQAAAKMGIFIVVRGRDVSPAFVDPGLPSGHPRHLIEPYFIDPHVLPIQARHLIVPFLTDPKEETEPWHSSSAMVMVPDGENVVAIRDFLKKAAPQRLVSIRVPATPRSAQRVLELTREGVEVIHLVFDAHGLEQAPSKPRHERDVLREVHGALVKAGIRDQVTLVASGGIALPEHMAKAIICGADLVAVDLPLVVALECRLCGECGRGEPCPIRLEETDPQAGAQRIVNLMGAWRNQLIEMLGAMGIREARRLRGETGRSMFFEDLERATFGRLFGKRKGEDGVQ
jgi:ferredoxin